MFGDRRAEMLARGEAAGHPASAAATLGLALSRLGEESPTAVGLLRLLACLAPEPVPVTVLLSDPQTANNLAPDAAAALGLLLGDPLAVGDAVAALRRYSLITPAGDGIVLVHRLVQAITVDQTAANVTGQWRHAAATLVGAAVPADTEMPAAWPVCAGGQAAAGELISDEPVPERRIVTVDIQGGVDQVRLVPVPGAKRLLLPRVERLHAKAQRPAGHRHGDTPGGKAQGPAGTSFWGDLAGEERRPPPPAANPALPPAPPPLRPPSPPLPACRMPRPSPSQPPIPHAVP